VKRVRLVARSAGLPLVFIAAVYWAMRPEPPQYVFAAKTVMTVTEKAGPALLYSPDPIYPAQALRDRIEGTVKLHVKIDSKGRVVKAEPLSGPTTLHQAAIEAAMHSQYAPEATETDLLIPFSLPAPRQ
jgi:TonB family protein